MVVRQPWKVAQDCSDTRFHTILIVFPLGLIVSAMVVDIVYLQLDAPSLSGSLRSGRRGELDATKPLTMVLDHPLPILRKPALAL
jgi:hypothetical protein